MTFIEKAFAIEVGMEDLDIENFKSLSATTALVLKKNGLGRRLRTDVGMHQLLTDAQNGRHEEFTSFVKLNVEPFAEQWIAKQRIPDAVMGAWRSGAISAPACGGLRRQGMGRGHVRIG